ncbi:MAG: M3 family metallopeptidase [Ectothiorhodospiraceae bacterium]|nr:M3 family metallopeptidase [Ectothiorhodospiraceae bacterium]
MTDEAPNPLLQPFRLPPFSRIRAEHVVPAIEHLAREIRAARDTILASAAPPTWAGTMQPLDELDDRLDRAWSPISHLNAVRDTPELRAAHDACLPLLSDLGNELAQDPRLSSAVRLLAADPSLATRAPERARVLELALRDLRLSGSDLPDDQKARYRELARELTELGSRFQHHVLDATQAWTRHVRDASELDGLPDSARRAAAERARRDGLEGWLLTLDFPCYLAVQTYAHDRTLRRELYEAWSTRASDQGPHAGQWDNAATIESILATRHALAGLLGFESYAAYSLARKMAPSAERVIEFLRDLARRARPAAERELAELARIARERDGITELGSHDLAYYAELLRVERYDISAEALRPYFPVPTVLAGLFEIVRRLFGVRVEVVEAADAWHPDVRLYRVRDDAEDGALRGEFYLDLYARSGKRGGAWMDECSVRHRFDTGVQTPIAYLTCNFGGPVGDAPALLTHDEVTTLFHEFGHGLHHLLTRVEHRAVSGIRGVAWDAVELPSQLLEHWCWEPEALALMSAHVDTGKPLPDSVIERLRAARTFNAGLQMLRQVEFALFDFLLHHHYAPTRGGRVLETLAAVRDEVAVVRPPASNRFPCSFTHIFAGGYAAGYYSYKWAEALAADAFAAFVEEGVLDPRPGRRFMETVLESGGSRDAMELFVAFRGREPTIDALLASHGLVSEVEDSSG